METGEAGGEGAREGIRSAGGVGLARWPGVAERG